MNTTSDLGKCLTFINCQLQPAHAPGVSENARAVAWRAVTISRQAGSGAHVVAEKLAEFLQARLPKGSRPWTVFDQNLVSAVLEDHQLPARLARFMPEDRVPEMEDTLDDLFGVHPPRETLVRQTTETILRLVEVGSVILIGRGANIITGRMPDVFHVRLVGTLEKRVEYFQQVRQVGKKAAQALVQQEDWGRRRYLKRHFDQDIDDPLLYHLIINTDRVGHEKAAQIMGEMVLAGQSSVGPKGKNGL